jgi:hypothetical protein
MCELAPPEPAGGAFFFNQTRNRCKASALHTTTAGGRIDFPQPAIDWPAERAPAGQERVSVAESTPGA